MMLKKGALIYWIMKMGPDSEDIDYFGDIPSEEDEEADYYNDFLTTRRKA